MHASRRNFEKAQFNHVTSIKKHGRLFLCDEHLQKLLQKSQNKAQTPEKRKPKDI